MRILIKNGMVYEKGRFDKKDILIQDEYIADISPDISDGSVDRCFYLNNGFVFPGFADVHVHLREPGFLYKETIATGTAAAARGGFTAICAMPNTKPVPDGPEALSETEELIRKNAIIRVLPYASITKGEEGRELVDFDRLARRVVAFSDDGRGVQSADIMKKAMTAVKRLGGIIAAHCEDKDLLRGGYIHDGEYARKHGHRGICSESEWAQVLRDIGLVRETGCRYHVCHVSTGESVGLIRRAKAEGLPVSCETAPHYLTLCEEDLQEDGRFKMNPPLRTREDRAALIEGVLDGTIDIVATDHAPHSAEEKGRGLEESLMGVVGLETAFPVLYTKLVKTGILSLEKLVGLMCEGPRKLFGLGGGEIRLREKADFTVFDLSRNYKINPEEFLSKGRSTPFAGMEVWGECVLTVADGRIVWESFK